MSAAARANQTTPTSESVRALIREALVVETLKSRGFALDGPFRRTVEPIVTPLLDNFVDIIAHADWQIATNSFQAASQTLLSRFAVGVEYLGVQNIPADGPVLLLSNHVGAYDESAIASAVQRRDLRVFSNDHPIFTSFPAVSDHAIYSGSSDAQRMAGLRTAVKRLREGSMLLLYPAGRTEPDPRHTPGASEAFANWSSSVELLVRKVPDLRVMIALISNVVSGRLLRNPLFAFRQDPLERQKLVTSVQMALQFGFPRLFNLVPRVTFGVASTLDELTHSGELAINDAIIARARQMLPLHNPGAPPLPRRRTR